MNLEHAIIVWAFDDAPEKYRSLSTHGGDEDWVALLPPSIRSAEDVWWMHAGGAFAIFDYSEHPLPDGRTVVIGAHA
jgi:hypothetical protein